MHISCRVSFLDDLSQESGSSRLQPVSYAAACSLKSTVFISAGFHLSKAGTVPGT